MKKIISFINLTMILVPISAFAEWEANVVDIFDGDTIIVSLGGRAEIIRLFGVDSPEKEQPFGLEARNFTSNLVTGKVIRIELIEKRRYEMVKVYVDDKCLNEELLRSGYAWYDLSGSIDANWVDMELQARYDKKGLWSQENPVPPWEYLSIKHKPTLKRSYTIKFPSKHEAYLPSVKTQPSKPAAPRKTTPKK